MRSWIALVVIDEEIARMREQPMGAALRQNVGEAIVGRSVHVYGQSGVEKLAELSQVLFLDAHGFGQRHVGPRLLALT